MAAVWLVALLPLDVFALIMYDNSAADVDTLIEIMSVGNHTLP